MGGAIADILFGEFNPSGKLPLTFPQKEDVIPVFGHFGSEKGNVRYAEGIFVGYRWYGKRSIKPLFPFGHGLSYTAFAYSDLTISPPPALITAHRRRQDGGHVHHYKSRIRRGFESSQVYPSDVVSSLTRPKKELKGFSKVHYLGLGETQTVTVSLGRESVSFWDDDVDSWRSELGVFRVRIHQSSAVTALEGESELKKGGTWRGL